MRVGLSYNARREARDDQPSLPPDWFAEWDDLSTIDAVAAVLGERHEVIPIEADEEAYIRFREDRPDIVFNIAEGLHGPGREAQIPGMLELLRIPYTGSDPVTLAVTLDKRRTREILQANGIPTPRQVVIESPNGTGSLRSIDLAREALGHARAILKPIAEGSSKGIPDTSLVEEEREWREQVERIIDVYGQAAIAEEFLPGREFTAAILGNGPRARVFPLVEIDLSVLPEGLHPIYSYEAKWIADRPEEPLDIFICPPEIPEDLDAGLRGIALEAYRVLGCRDWCRIDLRLDAGGHPRIIEVNPLPGILPDPEQNSCYPKAARAAGLSYSQMIHGVLEAAQMRTVRTVRTVRTTRGGPA